ncbi:MAG: hypothetical protein IPG23_20945 [Burkholderiales bacterium]|nr:hypothetical protein [Burkholderiales bacterium]
MQPLFDPTFWASSYRFRPGEIAQQAVVKAAQYIRSGKRWVVAWTWRNSLTVSTTMC